MLPLPGGQAAPLSRARVKACRAGGPCEESAPELGAGGVPVAAFDGPGEYAVRVALEDAAGNIGPSAAPVTLRFDDVRPGAPDVSAADAWHRGGALPLAVAGAPPVSGIRGYRVRIGGREAFVATSVPLDGLPEGGTPVEVSAVSGAGARGNGGAHDAQARPLAPGGGGGGRAGRLVARAGPPVAARARPDRIVGRAVARLDGRTTARRRARTATPSKSVSPRTGATP